MHPEKGYSEALEKAFDYQRQITEHEHLLTNYASDVASAQKALTAPGLTDREKERLQAIIDTCTKLSQEISNKQFELRSGYSQLIDEHIDLAEKLKNIPPQNYE